MDLRHCARRSQLPATLASMGLPISTSTPWRAMAVDDPCAEEPGSARLRRAEADTSVSERLRPSRGGTEGFDEAPTFRGFRKRAKFANICFGGACFMIRISALQNADRPEPTRQPILHTYREACASGRGGRARRFWSRRTLFVGPAMVEARLVLTWQSLADGTAYPKAERNRPPDRRGRRLPEFAEKVVNACLN